jgi:flagellar biosynthetic protein FliR
MNVIDLIPYLYERLILLILVFTRISAFFSCFVLFRRELVNARIIISLSAIISMYVLLFQQSTSVNYDVFSLRMLIQELFQFFVGFISGLILNIVFEVFTSLGQIISTQIGLSLASVLDPRFGNITSLTQFYMFSIMLVFLFLNGHLIVIKTLTDSFSVLPVGQYFIPNNMILSVLKYTSVIFSGAIMLSIAIIIAVLVVNFAMALMTKFAPQFNIFSIGINMTLILGLFCVYMTFNTFIDKGAMLVLDGLHFLQIALGKLK